MFVKHLRGRNEFQKVGNKLDHVRPDPVDGHRRPSLVIMPPHAGALA